MRDDDMGGSIAEILLKHGTDKQTGHNYGATFDRLFGGFRHTISRVLEIGIQDGQSIRAWEEIFPNAIICGIDIKKVPPVGTLSGRVKCFTGDATKMVGGIADCVAWLNGPIDLVIDDGSHRDIEQVETLRLLFPYMADRSWYVIEDVYPRMFGGKLLGLAQYEMVRAFHMKSQLSFILFQPPLVVFGKLPKGEATQ